MLWHSLVNLLALDYMYVSATVQDFFDGLCFCDSSVVVALSQ